MEPFFFTRRDFLRHLTLAGAAALLPWPAVEAGTGGLVAVGKVSAFPMNAVRAVALPGRRQAYVRRLPGRKPAFLVLSADCTHKGCPVSWDPADHRFHCPCHRGLYDAQGRNIGGPPPRPLARLAVQVAHGIVYVPRG